METVAYGGWKTCYRLANDTIELIVTAEVGPRVIRCGFIGGENLFAEFPEHLGQTGGDEWRIYGGHRLWHAPEAQPRTYAPDNVPYEMESIAATHETGLKTRQAVEPSTGIQKEMEIVLSLNQNRVRVRHRQTNRGPWSVELAPWALSVMNVGGVCIMPLPVKGSHEGNLLPVNRLVQWAYTDMADPRWTWGTKYILLRQDATRAAPQKCGLSIPAGWAAYARNQQVFIKTFPYDPKAVYPDFGCNMETFTNDRMLEVESLGPLVTLEPGASVEHLEQWRLFDDIPQPTTEAEVDERIAPLLAHI